MKNKKSHPTSNSATLRNAGFIARIPQKDTTNKKGSSLVLICVGMVSLLGFASFALDYSLLLADANQLQRACDSAALAGAAQLPDTDAATADIIEVGDANGITITAADITYTNSDTRVKVESSTTRSFLLGSVIGMSGATLSRHATSERATVDATGGAVPLSMTTDDFNNHAPGEEFTLKLGRNQEEDFTAGVMVAMDLKDGANAKTPSEWEENVASGMSETVDMNSTELENSLNASTSNQGKRLEDAINTRIAEGRTTMFIMLSDPKAQTAGTSYFGLKGIVPVEIISVAQNGNNPGYLTLKILDSLYLNSEDATIQTGTSNPGGLYVIRLLDDI